jgi:hypothetical protein
MIRVLEKIGLRSLAIVGLFLVAGCHWMQPQVQAPSTQVCPPTPVCPVCNPKVCPAPKVIEKIVKVPVPAKTGGDLDLPIIGEVEQVEVNPTGILYEARIDTGAESSSVHAENIQLVERDGEKYILFSLLNPEANTLVELERKLERRVLIKQKYGEPERRYVVKLWLTLGDIKERVDVTLSDRSDFTYRLLVGRNLLTDIAIVDVSRRHTLNQNPINQQTTK